MRPTNAWGRVQFTNEEDRIGKPKDVFSRNPTGYPMWTEAMKAAIGPLRRAGRKWYSLYDKVIAPANVKAAWDRIDKRVTGKKRQTGAGVDGVTVAKFANPGGSRTAEAGRATEHGPVQSESGPAALHPETGQYKAPALGTADGKGSSGAGSLPQHDRADLRSGISGEQPWIPSGEKRGDGVYEGGAIFVGVQSL